MRGKRRFIHRRVNNNVQSRRIVRSMRANKPAPLLPLYSLCLLRHAADFTRAIAMATSCGLLFSLPLALIATQLNSSLNYASFFYFELLRAYVRASIAPSQVRYIGIRVCVCVCVCVWDGGTTCCAWPSAFAPRFARELVRSAGRNFLLHYT